jgi:hypothetical protein
MDLRLSAVSHAAFEHLKGMTEPNGFAADETAPRDSQPVIADFEGQPDPEAELVLQALVATGSFRTGPREV